jgi:hypothetical protein
MKIKYCMSVDTRKWYCFDDCEGGTPILVDHQTGCFGNLISLVFHAYQERQNQRLYASCRSI